MKSFEIMQKMFHARLLIKVSFRISFISSFVFMNASKGETCLWGEKCCYGHHCPQLGKCMWYKLNRCRFVAGQCFYNNYSYMMTDCSSQPTCTRNQRIRMKNFCKTIVSWFCFSFYVNINSVCVRIMMPFDRGLRRILNALCFLWYHGRAARSSCL
jgi:hypothetical protein